MTAWTADPVQQPENMAKPNSVARWTLIIGAEIFATNLSQPEVLDLPLRKLLKDDLQFSPEAMVAFFAGCLSLVLKDYC